MTENPLYLHKKINTMKTSYVNVGLASLVTQGFSANLEGKITLYDNSNTMIDINNDVSQNYKNMPIKICGITIFLFCTQGSIDVKLSFKDYRLKKNDIFIVQSGQLGEFYNMSQDVKFFIMFVHNDFCNPLTQINSSTKLQDLLFRGPYHHCSDEEMMEMRQIYDFIYNKINSGYLYKEDVIKGYVYAMLYNIYSLSYLESQTSEEEKEPDRTGTSRQMEIYNRFIEEVQKHYAEEHKIGFYASKLCITPKYLSQIIYKTSGRFAKDYIKECLIMDAKVLLKTGWTIQAICDQLNFNSPTFFSRFFKENTGFTPFEYSQKG